MKTLLLMRHAKSSWGDETLPDHERPLNDRGRRDAPAMGRRLAESSFVPDRILCSTARRARETAELVVESLGADRPLDVREGIYHATPAEILAAIAESGDGDTLLVIGHNPGMGELVGRLTEFDDSMPTAAIAFIELPIDAWPEVMTASGRLLDFWKPQDEA
ncbi:MAG: histidine phosphatase family protein [Planctomycetota bacterium]|nr:histidine phosphatase family protein [Planctomycetaceae bacterium]MDQ3329185.1 histidine phosphatase family protein [Planctomycetota bacterium]